LRHRPVKHQLVDDFLALEALQSLKEAFLEEPRVRLESEIYSHERGTSPPAHPVLRAFCTKVFDERKRFGEAFKALTRIDGAAYLYKTSDYLLPHSDKGDSRALAYVFYLWPCGRGGELELFDCTTQGSQIVRTRPAERIAPKANRLVLFEVSETALHQVREITEGTRASIAGWLYP
jgi:Rps23 Pro-64 3,4-dihydroxylase Tpa1-like proline 4-hydroxylase